MFSGFNFFFSKELPYHTETRIKELVRKHDGEISRELQEDSYIVVENLEKVPEGVEFIPQKRKPPLIGVQCIIDTIHLQLPLPSLSQLPMLNRALNGLNICFTGFEKKRRSQIRNIATFMGAQVSLNLMVNTTHLVAQCISDSPKFLGAYNSRIPIVSYLWLEESWKKKLRLPLDKFYIPTTFYGLLVAISGIQPVNKRSEISELIQNNGGSFSGDLSKECTHLVVDPEYIATDDSSKYYWARKWNLIIVHFNWVYDSIKEKIRISENDPKYSVNVPIMNLGEDYTRKVVVDSCKSIVIPKAQQQKISRVYGTKENIYVIIPHDIGKSESSSDDGHITDNYLDGCRIFFLGIDDDKVQSFKKAIIQASGKRFKDYNERITHIVVGDMTILDIERNLEKLHSHFKNNPYVVSEKWLESCFVKKLLLSPDRYLIKYKSESTLPTFESVKNQQHKRKSDFKENVIEKRQKTQSMVDVPGSQIYLEEHLNYSPYKKNFVFNTVTFLCHGFAGSNMESIKNIILQNGGNVLLNKDLEEMNESNIPLIHYIVSPHGINIAPIMSILEFQKPVCVTSHWIENSIKQNKLLDVTERLYYSPLPYR